MPRHHPRALLLALAGLMSACGDRAMLDPDRKAPVDAGLASLFHTADPQAAGQLLQGFYSPEPFGRWTGPKFSIVLAVPRSPALADPALLVKLFIPDNQMARLKSIRLACSVNGVALPPETFTTPGTRIYARSLPAAAMAGGQVRADFTLDKWMQPSAQDTRELGIVVTVVALKNGVSGDL